MASRLSSTLRQAGIHAARRAPARSVTQCSSTRPVGGSRSLFSSSSSQGAGRRLNVGRLCGVLLSGVSVATATAFVSYCSSEDDLSVKQCIALSRSNSSDDRRRAMEFMLSKLESIDSQVWENKGDLANMLYAAVQLILKKQNDSGEAADIALAALLAAARTDSAEYAAQIIKSGAVPVFASVAFTGTNADSQSSRINDSIVAIARLAQIDSYRVWNECAKLVTNAFEGGEARVLSVAAGVLRSCVSGDVSSVHAAVTKQKVIVDRLRAILLQAVEGETDAPFIEDALIASGILLAGPSGAKVPFFMDTLLQAATSSNSSTTTSRMAFRSAVFAVQDPKSPTAARFQDVFEAAVLILADKSKSENHESCMQLIPYLAKRDPVALLSQPMVSFMMKAASSKSEETTRAGLGYINYVINNDQSACNKLVNLGAADFIMQAAATHRQSTDICLAITGLLHTMCPLVKGKESLVFAHKVMPVLFALMETGDIMILRTAMRALGDLCKSEFNRFNLLSGGGAQDIVRAFGTGDRTLVQEATRVAGLMMSTPNAVQGENIDKFVELGAMRALCTLANSTDPVIHRNALWCLSCISQSDRNIPAMGPCVSTLLKVLQFGSNEGKRYAAMAVSNMTSHPQVKEFLVQQDVQALLTSAAKAHPSDLMLGGAVQQAVSNIVRNSKVVFTIPLPKSEAAASAAEV